MKKVNYTGLLIFLLTLTGIASNANAVQFYYESPAVSENIPQIPKDQIRNMALLDINTGQTMQKSLDSLSLDDLAKLDTKAGGSNQNSNNISATSEVNIPVTVAVAVPVNNSTPTSVTVGINTGSVSSAPTSGASVATPTISNIGNLNNIIGNHNIQHLGSGGIPIEPQIMPIDNLHIDY